MDTTLARAWWVLVIRGIVDILIGIIAFMAPFATMQAIILLFGAYAIVDGVIALVTAIRAAQKHERWWTLVIEGIVGVVLGLGALFVPGVTILALVAVVAVWAILTGIFEISAAIRLRRAIAHEWILGLAGVLSVIFGILLAAFPVAGAVWLVTLIGAYALIFGVLMLILGFRLRSFSRHTPDLQPTAA
jgi:uncharacterized membrane protein HdeD (DUF308 family)